MTVIDNYIYNKILSLLNTIQLNPKEVKYFFLDENKKFIIEGEKLKSLPVSLHKHYTKDEFYVHVDVLNKRVQFYSFDLKDYISSERINQYFGSIPWCKEIEDSIHNFLLLNIKDLSSATFPYSDNKNISNSTEKKPTTHSYPEYESKKYDSWNDNKYYTSNYKEREDFINKLNSLLKNSKTCEAIDCSNEFIIKLNKENKKSTIDDILRIINFDKINLPFMVSVLESIKDIDNLQDRQFFFNKAKTYVEKLKSNKANTLLNIYLGNKNDN